MTHIILKFHNDNNLKFHDDTDLRFHDVIEVTGGPGGGRSQQKGVSILEKDRSLGPRPHFIAGGESSGKLQLKPIGSSKGKLSISTLIHSEAIIIPTFQGLSISKLQIPTSAPSEAKIKLETKGESYNLIPASYVADKMYKGVEKMKKLVQLTTLFHMIESIDDMYDKKSQGKRYEFSFSETCHDELLHAFTHSSTFVGNVQYNPEEQSMKIILNGKTYKFCNVPERVYDAFEGAGSKGAFFARNIKGLFDC